MTIVSTATDWVTGTITGVNVGYYGPSARAVNPAGTELFVVLENYGVDVINLSTDRVVATVALAGARPSPPPQRLRRRREQRLPRSGRRGTGR